MNRYLTEIVARKREEIAALPRLNPLPEGEGTDPLSQGERAFLPLPLGEGWGEGLTPWERVGVKGIRFYTHLQANKAAGHKVNILEFKRRSPSMGAINEAADLPSQVRAYTNAGASAISILTDSGFGGSFADLSLARQHTHLPLLCKDFILDAVQLQHAAAAGANAVLLIAAILERAQLVQLRDAAYALDLGVLLELHDAADLAKVEGLDFPVVGVNNRDLNTFRLSLNRANWLARQLPAGVIRITESGITSAMDYAFATRLTDGALIGTALMQHAEVLPSNKHYFLKACGIREAQQLQNTFADLLGVNFSPRSKRRIDPALLDRLPLPDNAVALFAENPAEDRATIVQRYGFKAIQVYHEDVTPAEVAALDLRVWLAIRGAGEMPEADLLALAEAYAPYVTGFILDSAEPGAGQAGQAIPASFPYPFLLAGGLHAGNLHRVADHPLCLGADVASGIERDGRVDEAIVAQVRHQLQHFTFTTA